MSHNDEKDWRSIAAQATKETDPEKLVKMVEELCGVLQQREQKQRAEPKRG